MLSGQLHTIQNKACCWHLQTINNSKVCAAAGGRTTKGGAPHGWHKKKKKYLLQAACQMHRKTWLSGGHWKMLFSCLQYLWKAFAQTGLHQGKCRREVFLHALQPPQLVLLLPDETGIPDHPTDKSFPFILSYPWGFTEVTGAGAEHLRKESFLLSPLTQGEARGTAETAKGTTRVYPGSTANVKIRMVSQDTEERKFRML